MTREHAPAWSWCCHVDRHDIRDRPRRGDVPGLAVWHKIAGPWSRCTFCGQDARWMAPRKWLRTTTTIGRPYRDVTNQDIKPAGMFCELCQSVSLHDLVPPGFPKWCAAVDCLVMADYWEERGDGRAELLKAIAEPDWTPTLNPNTVLYGPWGTCTVNGPAHYWKRGAGRQVMRNDDPGLRLNFGSLCGSRQSEPTLAIAWQFDAPPNPCRNCLQLIPAGERDAVLDVARSKSYAPFRYGALEPLFGEHR